MSTTPTPTIHINSFGCAVLVICLLAVPCLAVWYFGTLSLILSFTGIALLVCGLYFTTAFRQWEKLWGIAALILSAASFGTVVYLNYFLK